jgi:parallel beta-helix repeat protein
MSKLLAVGLGLVIVVCPSSVLASVIQVGKDVPSITAAIATKPKPGTVIQVPAGTYSTNTGEVFPLRIPRGVTLRGNASQRGAGVLIWGGGKFISPTFADQNAAILPADGAIIEGVSVTNSNPRGYGIWVESSQRVQILNNTLTGNTHDGLFLTGKAEALVLNNLFRNNTGSGLSAVGTSTGEIRQNIFDNTGFGLSIGQKSQVKVIANQITNNVDGIVITHEAQPLIRDNVIAGSQRDGVVIVADRDRYPQPDLGRITSNGGNTFRNNRLNDIRNLTPVAIAAVGNQLEPSRVSGKLDMTVNPVLTDRPLRFPASLRSEPVPAHQLPTTPTGLKFPDSLRRDVKSQDKLVQSPSKTIIIERLPRPISPQSALVLDPRTGQPMRFRVVVPISSESDLARIRTVIPDAFRLYRSGQMLAQIGAYSDRPDAEAQATKVTPLGFQANIVDF